MRVHAGQRHGREEVEQSGCSEQTLVKYHDKRQAITVYESYGRAARANCHLDKR